MKTTIKTLFAAVAVTFCVANPASALDLGLGRAWDSLTTDVSKMFGSNKEVEGMADMKLTPPARKKIAKAIQEGGIPHVLTDEIVSDIYKMSTGQPVKTRKVGAAKIASKITRRFKDDCGGVQTLVEVESMNVQTKVVAAVCYVEQSDVVMPTRVSAKTVKTEPDLLKEFADAFDIKRVGDGSEELDGLTVQKVGENQ